MKTQISVIFNSQLALSAEILTEIQETNAFDRACDLFFGTVSPIVKIKTVLFLEKNLELDVEYTNDELGLGINSFLIRRIVDGGDYTFLKITPVDYQDFKLDLKYKEDFRLVSEFVIKDISASNQEVLKGVGLENTELSNLLYSDIKEALERKYNTESGDTISTIAES